jgi:peroxiredoxin
MATEALASELGKRVPDFALKNVDGRVLALQDLKGPNGTVVVFICNHCPYVRAITGRLVSDAQVLSEEGISMVAINANDATTYPEDSFENMVRFARERGFTFPYLHDETQEVARAYGAVCTPDFFGFDRDLILLYRGRLDAGRTEPLPAHAKRELVEAMRAVVRTGKGPDAQHPSIGCSIKWKTMQ